jgi:hypothetical protein
MKSTVSVWHHLAEVGRSCTIAVGAHDHAFVAFPGRASSAEQCVTFTSDEVAISEDDRTFCAASCSLGPESNTFGNGPHIDLDPDVGRDTGNRAVRGPWRARRRHRPGRRRLDGRPKA